MRINLHALEGRLACEVRTNLYLESNKKDTKALRDILLLENQDYTSKVRYKRR